MKVLSLIALIFAACVYFTNAQYSPTSLTSGTQVTGITTSSTNTVCNYYSLTVPANTGAVRIDLTSTSTNYVSITTGFNYFPDADRDTTNNGYSYDFYDNNVINGGAARYYLCTYDPNTTPGASNSFPSTSLSSGCAAWVPNLHLGGKVYICLSSYSSSTATSGTSLTATNIALTSTTAVGVSGTAVPVAAATSSALYSVIPYAISIPTNSTGISVTTTSSSTVLQGPGFYSNAYTTGNSLSLGGYQLGQTIYFMVVQTSTSAQSFTFTNTFSSCTSGQYMISSSSSCYNVTTLTSGTAASLTYTSGTYQLFQITAPTTVPTNKFYMLTIATTNTFVGTAYVTGRSFLGLDTTVKAYGSFQNNYGGQSLSSGTQTYTYHYLYPGQAINIVLYSSATTTTTLTATVAAETGTSVVVGTSTTAATSTPSAASSYVTLNPFTVTGSSGYLIKMTSTGLSTGTVNTQGLQIYSSDLSTPYVTTGLKTSSSNLYTIYVPANTLTSGSYFLVNSPSSTTGRTVTFTTSSPSSSGSMTAPAVTFIIAIIAFVLLALN